ncbi:copper chaperone PCu(A)C [Streptomyces sp. enrichment culture]|uniref:copper chaperone PCu(A)C n=1 Tax=Streptomyces sp. enrichment culture TaxID=1795815 RepID=UPI003F56E72E
MTTTARWRPSRRRLTDTLPAVLAPVAACGIALGGLTAWTAAGQAGTPARVAVSDGRVFLPFGDSTETAVFFDLTNHGGADDRLLRVTSPAVGGPISLSLHRMAGSGAAYRDTVDSAAVPAGGGLSMSPEGLDLTLRPEAGWRAGDLVPFTLHFAHSGTVEALAVVVRPGSPAS